MGASNAVPQVVLVGARMSEPERDAALAGLASGVRTVEMPVSEELAEGRAAHRSDPYRAKGDVELEAVDGKVWATRARAHPTGTGGWNSYFGPRSYEVSFNGRVDAGARVVQGSVSSQVKRYNRTAVPCAVVAGLGIGFGIAAGVGHLWLAAILAPVIVLLFLAVAFVTDRREAKIVLADLERIARLAVAEGVSRPPGPQSRTP